MIKSKNKKINISVCQNNKKENQYIISSFSDELKEPQGIESSGQKCDVTT